jgi:hypothetical protein
MKTYALITIASIALISFGTAFAQTSSSIPTTNSNVSASSTPDGAFEERKLSIETERLRLENERENKKLDLEKTKAWLTAFSLVVPLLAALATIFYSSRSFRKQLKENAAQQKEAAKLQFEMKAAEIAFAGKTPTAVVNRGNMLKKIFGDRLPAGFPGPIVPEEHGGGHEPSEEKLLLLKLLAEHHDRRAEILMFWEALFPIDKKWLDRVTALESTSKEAESASGNPTLSEATSSAHRTDTDVVPD